MKNVKLILASFCLVLVGCSDDDDPVSSTSYTLSGTFNATSMTSYATEDCSGDGDVITMEMLEAAGEEIPTVTFAADGTCGDGCTYTCSSATSCTMDGLTLTVNSDGTVTSVGVDEAYCADANDDVDYDDYISQEQCEANGSAAGAADGVWYDASSCTSIVWTAATGS